MIARLFLILAGLGTMIAPWVQPSGACSSRRLSEVERPPLVRVQNDHDDVPGPPAPPESGPSSPDSRGPSSESGYCVIAPRMAEACSHSVRVLEPVTIIALDSHDRCGGTAVERAMNAGAPLVISQTHSRAASLGALAPRVLAHAPPSSS